MKKQYINPVISTAIIPFAFIMGEVSTGTSSLPGGGTTSGGATGGIGQGAPKRI